LIPVGASAGLYDATSFNEVEFEPSGLVERRGTVTRGKQTTLRGEIVVKLAWKGEPYGDH
jgi:hypothetical protein